MLEKIQDIGVKRKKEQKQQAKNTKQRGRGENKEQLTTDANVSADKRSRRGSMSLVDDERAIHEAYQVLLTEYHNRRDKRKRHARQSQTKQGNRDDDINGDFAALRRKQLDDRRKSVTFI